MLASKILIFQGVDVALLDYPLPSDSLMKVFESVAENWYSTRLKYQFPGGNESFDSCDNDTSVDQYGPFTQVFYKNLDQSIYQNSSKI